MVHCSTMHRRTWIPARIIILCGALMDLTSAWSQGSRDLLHLGSPEGRVEAHVMHDRGTFHPKDSLVYYWYKDQQVHSTQGGAGDVLLDGPYREYYPDGQIKTTGEFRKGLKHGEWRTWATDGRLSTVEEWRNGKKKEHTVRPRREKEGSKAQEKRDRPSVGSEERPKADEEKAKHPKKGRSRNEHKAVGP